MMMMGDYGEEGRLVIYHESGNEHAGSAQERAVVA
jgi:hypothetical protein